MPPDASPSPLLGRSHPLTRRVRLLTRSPLERERQRLMPVEGVRLAEEALAENARIHEAILSPRLERDDRGRRLAARLLSTVPLARRATDDLLASMSDTATHQGVLLLVERPEAGFDDVTASGAAEAIVLVAWEVQDPGNLGTLVRLTDAAGGAGLVSVSGADPFGPRAVRASAGSIFRLPVARVGGGAAEVGSLAERLRGSGLALAGAVTRGGDDYRQAELPGRLALFLGGEGDGLPAGVLDRLDHRLTIPIRPRVESLNVAAAAAVLLFEAAARRRGTASPGEA